MKTIRVVAAVICDSIEHKTKIIFHGKRLRRIQRWLGIPRWEDRSGRNSTAGGCKRDPGGTGCYGQSRRLIDTIEYDYPAFHLSMDCFWCEVASGELKLLEAEAAKWLTKEELDSVQWLPADVTLIEKIKSCMP